MPELKGDSPAVADVSSDAMMATLRLRANADPARISEDTCLNLLREREVQITREVAERVRELLAAHKADPTSERSGAVATGSIAEHGSDERLELASECKEAPAPSAVGATGIVSHYERTSFVMVRRGQTLGRLIPATDGHDGATVQGRVLAAKAGKRLNLKTDESVIIGGDGAITAAFDGLLENERGGLRVLRHLEIAENVDFSTGNIDFTGDVRIREGVRDCFKVFATGTITALGVVDGAIIQSAGSVRLEGGMAGRDIGIVRAERDLFARYLSGVHASVGRCLEVEKEIVNCKIEVGGKVVAPRCTVIGGTLCASGTCEVDVLGGNGGDRTEVVLGGVPGAERLFDHGRQLLPAIEVRRAKFQTERDALLQNSGKLSAHQAERMTELQFELAAADTLSARLSKGLRRLQGVEQSHTVVDLIVHSCVHRGVCLALRDLVVEFAMDVKGPLRITLDATGKPFLTDLTSNSTTDLREVARVLKGGEKSADAA